MKLFSSFNDGTEELKPYADRMLWNYKYIIDLILYVLSILTNSEFNSRQLITSL